MEGKLSNLAIDIDQVSVVLYCCKVTIVDTVEGLEGQPSTALNVGWTVLERARSASVFWKN